MCSQTRSPGRYKTPTALCVKKKKKRKALRKRIQRNVVLERKEDLHLNRPGIAASKEQPFLPPLLTSPQASQIPSSLGEVQLSLISKVTAEILRGHLHRTCVSPCWDPFFFLSFNSNCREEILRSDSPMMTTAHSLVCPDQSDLNHQAGACPPCK